MSFLGKIFVGKTEENGLSTHKAIQKLRETEELLLKKLEFLERKIETKIQTARKHGTKNKRAAIAALIRKKRYEKQLIQIDGTLTQIEAQRDALEGANTNSQVLNTMKEAAHAMYPVHKDMYEGDLDKEMLGINVPTDTLPDVPAAEFVHDKPKPSKSKKEDNDEDFKLLQSWAT